MAAPDPATGLTENVIDVLGYRYDRQDTVGTLRAIGSWWQQLAQNRTIPDTFAAALRRQADVLGAFVQADVGEHEHFGVVDRFGEQAATLVRHGADATQVLTDSLALLARAGEALRVAGSLPIEHRGAVAHLASSKGGVPKRSVDDVAVDRNGVVGDVQRTRLHHGRPWQALCIWSTEVIDEFAADGHPLAMGSAGENITVSGIPWQLVQSGVRLRIGDVLAEASLFALPCKKNARWFSDGDFTLMHHDRGPVSRIYASVLEPGRIRLGDAAVLEPS
jgi:MOSC domain-containing protein YiiM